MTTLQRSRGYSCTFEENSCTVARRARGQRTGAVQHAEVHCDRPERRAVYRRLRERTRPTVELRTARFAGEAVSDGSGINKGDRPSFVIGNMGKPASVSVNSSKFYVVDRDEQFVHVFGALPFKDIADDAVTVTYVSDQDFPNPNITGNDSFRILGQLTGS